MEVTTGIHKVEGRGMSNGYVVEIDDGLLVVDAASAGHTLETIRALGRPAQDVMVIVITHWHADHIGGAEELRRRTGARVAVHELDAAVLAGGEFPAKGRRIQRLIRRVFRIRPVAADLLLHDGDEVAGWHVVHMPGHTAGSIALHRRGVVFTGDALRCDRHGRVLLPDLHLSQDPEAALRSVERIRALHPELLLPGHGAPAHRPHLPTTGSSRTRLQAG